MITYNPSDFRIVKYDYGIAAPPKFKIERRKYRRKYILFGKFIPTDEFEPTCVWIGGGDGYYEEWESVNIEDARKKIRSELSNYFTKVSYIQYPIQEIADRWSIAQLKYERAGRKNESEVREYRSRIEEYNDPELLTLCDKLLEFNGKIWDLESDIRLGKENELGYEEVGNRAILIRNLNAERIKVKNEIQTRFSEGFVEFKHNHASSVAYENQN